jgi:hypothetical protein
MFCKSDATALYYISLALQGHKFRPAVLFLVFLPIGQKVRSNLNRPRWLVVTQDPGIIRVKFPPMQYVKSREPKHQGEGIFQPLVLPLEGSHFNSVKYTCTSRKEC